VYFGFNVMLTGKRGSGGRMREVMTRLDLGKFLLETDAPYLRSTKRDRETLPIPAHVTDIGKMIADIRFIEPKEVFLASTAACRKFYRLPEENVVLSHKAVPLVEAAECWT